MKYLYILLLVLLSGCTTVVPVKQTFPEAPEILFTKCPNLETIEHKKVLLSDLMRTVTKNYMKYHDCKELNEAWQQWYKDQKKIFEEINSKK